MFSRRVAYVTAAVVVTLALASGAAVATPPPATPTPPSDSSPSTATPIGTPGNATTGGGGLVPSIDPAAFVLEALDGVVAEFAAGVATLVDAFSALVFGVPAPGDPGDVETWGPPTGGLWSGAWTLYWALAPLGLAVLVLQAMRASASTNRRAARRRLTEVVGCAAAILVGWPLAVGGLHLADALAMALAPDGAAFLSSPNGIAKLGLGIVLGAGVVTLQSGLALTALGVVFVEKLLLVAAVAGMPIWWAFRPADGGFANVASGIGFSIYLGVAGAKVLQSAIAALVFHADGILASVVGLLVVFVGIPLVVARNVVPEAMTVLGTPAVNVAENYADAGRSTASDAASDAARGYAASARSRAADATAGWRRSSTTDRGADRPTAPDGYTPTREPGARADTSGSSGGDAAGSSDTRTRTMQERRVEKHRRQRR